MPVRAIPKCLTVAGSDSGGGAGIQADLKTFAALGVHGMSAITAVTAQDTLSVHSTYVLPPLLIQQQIEVVFNDIGVDAVKTGMLADEASIRAVSESLENRTKRLVVDPVMVTTGGAPLMQPSALEALKQFLFPLALVVTPNLREAEMLVQRSISSQEDLSAAAEEIHNTGPAAVLIKGGHWPDSRFSSDYFFDGSRLKVFSTPRINTKNTHGSGCTLAAAIAAYLAHGKDLERAVSKAKDFVTRAIQHSLDLGKGPGPLGHFFKNRN